MSADLDGLEAGVAAALRRRDLLAEAAASAAEEFRAAAAIQAHDGAMERLHWTSGRPGADTYETWDRGLRDEWWRHCGERDAEEAAAKRARARHRAALSELAEEEEEDP